MLLRKSIFFATLSCTVLLASCQKEPTSNTPPPRADKRPDVKLATGKNMKRKMLIPPPAPPPPPRPPLTR
jgi:hypothetical protein